MSRSNPNVENPAKRFFRWSGSKGVLTYYDKSEQKEVEVKPPFEFMVLDQLATITGYSDQDESSYWSNEVRSVSRDEFIVKTSKGIKQSGLYQNLADVRSKGAKYAKSIYIAFKDEGNGLVIGNIKASGAALTAWIEFSKRAKVEEGKVTLKGSEEAKKGATTYYVPIFEHGPSGAEDNDIAIELDKELQAYLSQYLNAAKFDRAADTWEDGSALPTDEEIDSADLESLPY